MSNFIRTCALGTLLTAYLCCSGCATILGGIIGHQSGEMAAGIAIGAALDFGGDIVNGIGYLLTDKKTRFEQKVSLDSEEGKIEFAKSDFSVDKMERLMRKLEKKFEQNGWSHTVVQKKRQQGRTLLSEKWQCKDVNGNEFELSILREKCKDTQILIMPTDEDTLSRNAITIDVYNWFMEAAIGPS
ncbi:MAG: hypothetical protein GY774_40330 [Planctomycetes bacterium]|nr:hypothetical protein [Planctomycetota bacterium]